MIEHHNTVSPSITPAPASAPPAALRFSVYAALWFSGVILPLIALAMLAAGVCLAQMTISGSAIVHLFLIASVALANGTLVSAMRRGQPALARPLALLHALATGAMELPSAITRTRARA